MAMMQSQLQLEKRAYQEELRNLFNLDGDAARKVIGEVFRFN